MNEIPEHNMPLRGQGNSIPMAIFRIIVGTNTIPAHINWYTNNVSFMYIDLTQKCITLKKSELSNPQKNGTIISFIIE